MSTGKHKRSRTGKAPEAQKRPDPAHIIKQRLKNACSQIAVTHYTDYRLYLKDLYESIKTSRKSYSYPRFAADLGLSETNALWQVLTSRRDLADSSAEKIAQSLPIIFEDKKYFLLLVKHNNSRNSDIREECMREMVSLNGRSLEAPGEENTLEYFSEWYHPVIREMVGLDEFQADPDWINERLFLKVAPRRIENSLSLLQKLNLIQYDEQIGRFKQSSTQIFPTRKVGALASIRYHQKASEIAKESVAGVDPKRRDLNVLTLCISDDLANEAIKILHDACYKIMELESKASRRDQVYQINVQLFAMTKNKL